MRRIVIDHFEGGTVICENENKEKLFLLKSDIPRGAREGDCLLLSATGKFAVDEECSRVRREQIGTISDESPDL